MSNLIDLTGQRFGRWGVQTTWRKHNNNTEWLCVCDCGAVRYVGSGRLRKGRTLSCGCLRHEMNTLPTGEAAFNRLFSSYKRDATKRGHSFELPKRYFSYLIRHPCGYCGRPPSNYTAGTVRNNGGITFSGVDRIDNEVGYTKDNCVPCCTWCNRAKGPQSAEEFLQHCKEVVLNG